MTMWIERVHGDSKRNDKELNRTDQNRAEQNRTTFEKSRMGTRSCRGIGFELLAYVFSLDMLLCGSRLAF